MARTKQVVDWALADGFYVVLNVHQPGGLLVQLEFNSEPWTDAIYDPVRDDEYVLYHTPDGATVTCDL